MSDTHADHAGSFVASLYALVQREDRAALAALRRGLGKRPGEVAEMFPYVVPYCAHLSESRQNDYFLVAALFAAHQGAAGEPDPYRNNLGASYRALADRAGSASIQLRFVALLNAVREDLDDHLRHAISLMKAHEVTVDWAQLLRDIAGWSWESRNVQRRWAQSYWGNGESASVLPVSRAGESL
jgi:CRISPR system Cascade subunit CasB